MTDEDDVIQLNATFTQRQKIFYSNYERKQALKDCLEKTQLLDENTNADSINALEEVIQEADVIYEDLPLDDKVVNQDEVVLDSEVMSVSSKVIKTCTQTLSKSCNKFTGLEFAEKLLAFVDRLPDATLAEPNWSILARELPQLKTTANFMCLADNVNCTKKKTAREIKMEQRLAQKAEGTQRATQRNRLTHDVAKKRPENVVNVTKEEKAIEESVTKIRKLIKDICKEEKQPLDYFRLILDPNDFSKTIENMLHVSFLVKDGFIKMYTDNDGHLVVRPRKEYKEKDKDEQSSDEVPKFQCICDLDMETWRELKDMYRITEPLINF